MMADRAIAANQDCGNFQERAFFEDGDYAAEFRVHVAGYRSCDRRSV